MYFLEELEMARHTLSQGGTILEWTQAFATSIDELAWFGLLFIFELETWVLEDDVLQSGVAKVLQAIRLICYAFLAHTIFAWSTALIDMHEVQVSPEITNVCELADQDISFSRNLEYTIITAENCSQFSEESTFFMTDPTVVTDESGFKLDKQLAWFDLSDAIVWLLVILSIELAVQLQERGITGGRLMFVSHAAKVCYAILLLDAAFWGWHGHWLYSWDQCLWIGGFMAIEMNVSDWREELREKFSRPA